MLEQLFGSKTRVKLLHLLYRHPDQAFFVRELTRKLDTQINAVRRELETLMDIGLVKVVDAPGNVKTAKKTAKAGANLRKYYMLDPTCILYTELGALLVKGRLMGEQTFVRTLKEKAGDLTLLLLTGHFTGDKRTDSDMLLVGDVKERTVAKLISGYEKECGFDIRYTIMDTKEFEDRRHIMDKFLYSLFEAKNMIVVDETKQNV